jgi:hypothetical protein
VKIFVELESGGLANVDFVKGFRLTGGRVTAIINGGMDAALKNYKTLDEFKLALLSIEEDDETPVRCLVVL